MFSETSLESTMRAHASAVRHRLRNPAPIRPQPKPETPVIKNSGYRVPRMANRPYSIKWREIVASTAGRHGLTEKDLLSPDRYVPTVRARAEAMWLMHRYTDMTISAIGKRFGRDHTTVLHNLRKNGPTIEARFA